MTLRITCSHTFGGVARDLRTIARNTERDQAAIVRSNAHEGNRLAKANASEQHTMFSDYDIDYPPSFTTERVGRKSYVYGPDSAIGDGSKSPGYEHGSINSPPHHDLLRSVTSIVPEFHLDVEDYANNVFWPGSQ
jgi:hypothetical protein